MKLSSILFCNYYTMLIFVLVISAFNLLDPITADENALEYNFVPLGSGSVGGNPLVAELRERLQGLLINPFYTTNKQLERLLEDSGYSVDRAAQRLGMTATFRAVIRADELLTWTPSHFLQANFPIEHSGYTADGNPIFILPLGQWNFREYFHTGGRASELFYYFMRFLEEATRATVGRVNPRTGGYVDQVVFLVDARDYSTVNFLCFEATWTLIRILRAAGRHYPFLVKKAIVVNAPITFKALWKVARIFGPGRLRTSYRVYTSWEEERARNALVHNFPISTIPVELGGTFLERNKHFYFVEEDHSLAKRNASSAAIVPDVQNVQKNIRSVPKAEVIQQQQPPQQQVPRNIANVQIHARSVLRSGGIIQRSKPVLVQTAQSTENIPSSSRSPPPTTISRNETLRAEAGKSRVVSHTAPKNAQALPKQPQEALQISKQQGVVVSSAIKARGKNIKRISNVQKLVQKSVENAQRNIKRFTLVQKRVE